MSQTFASTLLENAVNEFSNLPGIGRKTALRLVLHILRQEPQAADNFGNAIIRLRHDIRYCRVCHNISDTDVCNICSDASRSEKSICVVEKSSDIGAIEKSGAWTGKYHVLGGKLSPLNVSVLFR